MFKASFKLHRISDVGPMPYEEISGLHWRSTWYKTEDNFFYKKNRTNSPNSTVQHLICINNRRSQKQLDISPEAPFCRGKINCYLLSFHNDFTNRIYLSLSATAKIDQDGLTLRSQHTHTPGTQSFFVPLSFKGHQDLKMSFFVLYRTKCVPFPVEMPSFVGFLCKCGQKNGFSSWLFIKFAIMREKIVYFGPLTNF